MVCFYFLIIRQMGRDKSFTLGEILRNLMNAYGYTSSTASGPPVSLRLGHAAGLTAHRAVIQHRGRRFTTLKGKAMHKKTAIMTVFSY